MEIGDHWTVWPFPDPPETEIFTTRAVIEEGERIKFVTHDAEDGAWQFMHSDKLDVDDVVMVTFRDIIRHDPTLMILAKLPPGWGAIRQTPSPYFEWIPIGK